MSFDLKTSIAVCSALNLLIVSNTELSEHTCLIRECINFRISIFQVIVIL